MNLKFFKASSNHIFNRTAWFNAITIVASFVFSFLGGCLLLIAIYRGGLIKTKSYDSFTSFSAPNLSWPSTSESVEQNNQDFKTAKFPLSEFIQQNGQAVNNFLNDKKQSANYGIYFAEISDPVNIYTHNADSIFGPASMYKVPLTIVVLHLVEKGEIKLTDVISVQKTGTNNYKKMTVADTISIMIRESNNEAMTALEKKAGGYYRVQRFFSDLGLRIVRRGQETTANNMAKAFRILVDPQNTFINQDSKNYILGHMFNVVNVQRDRIPTGVNQYFSDKGTSTSAAGVKVANKIGNLDGIYQDGAIIFARNRTYVLIILDHKQITTKARENIQIITKLLLKNLE